MVSYWDKVRIINDIKDKLSRLPEDDRKDILVGLLNDRLASDILAGNIGRDRENEKR